MSIDLAVMSFIYLCFLFPRWRKKELLFHSVTYLYLVSVFMLTLSPCISSLNSIFTHSYQPMVMEPFRDIIAGYDYADIQIALNILLFIPFGFLVPKVKNTNLVKILLFSFVLSLCIELVQPLLNVYRRSDITDIICNTLGGLIGYILYRYLKRWVMSSSFILRNKCNFLF